MKTALRSWLKQLCSSKNALQMTPNVKKIILQLVCGHCTCELEASKETAVSIRENNSGIHPSTFFSCHVHTAVNPGGGHAESAACL